MMTSVHLIKLALTTIVKILATLIRVAKMQYAKQGTIFQFVDVQKIGLAILT